MKSFIISVCMTAATDMAAVSLFWCSVFFWLLVFFWWRSSVFFCVIEHQKNHEKNTRRGRTPAPPKIKWWERTMTCNLYYWAILLQKAKNKTGERGEGGEGRTHSTLPASWHHRVWAAARRISAKHTHPPVPPLHPPYPHPSSRSGHVVWSP